MKPPYRQQRRPALESNGRTQRPKNELANDGGVNGFQLETMTELAAAPPTLSGNAAARLHGNKKRCGDPGQTMTEQINIEMKQTPRRSWVR